MGGEKREDGLSINSSSGTTAPFNSSIAPSYASTFFTVCSASGCFDRISASPAIGWNTVAKWVANPTPLVKRLDTPSVNALVSLSSFSVAVSIEANRRA